MRSAVACGPPLYGTCTSLMPVRFLSSSPARCPGEPVLDEPYVSWPGRAFASVMSSATVLDGKDGCATSSKLTATLCVIGERLFAASYGSLYKLGLVANAVAPSKIVYPSGGDLAA